MRFETHCHPDFLPSSKLNAPLKILGLSACVLYVYLTLALGDHLELFQQLKRVMEEENYNGSMPTDPVARSRLYRRVIAKVDKYPELYAWINKTMKDLHLNSTNVDKRKDEIRDYMWPRYVERFAKHYRVTTLPPFDK